jgi:tetratricopeptide (TPR) repeat protein
MKFYLRFSILFILVIFSVLSFGQAKDEQLASQYFSNNEFDKAADVYEKLLNKNPQSIYFYDNLLSCYFNLNKAEEAEKLVKKQIRKNDRNPYYTLDLGYVMKKFGKADKAKQQFDDIIKKLKLEGDQINETGNAFIKRGEKEYAIETYLKGRKMHGSNLAYSTELGNLYGETGNMKEMIEEYLNSMSIDEKLLDDIQGYFQNYIQKPAEFDLLKSALLKRTKTQAENPIFFEMLVWMYVQKKDFDNALLQAKSLDKKFKEEGARLIELGNLAISNEYYDAAVNIFNQVVLMGKDKNNYTLAKMGILEAQRRKILNSNYTDTDLKIVETNYKAFLDEFGKNPFTQNSQRELARLQAYYLNDLPYAMANFNELISAPRSENKFKAECKLELGDLYVLKGEVWDAMLLYGQVDKEYMEEPIGQEAKLRNAKLSYYIGEFEWAKAQLDVLKTVTTQLIANNALELSLLIQDNTVDSVEDALKMFSRADLNYYQNKTDVALQILDSINLLFPKHALADDIYFKKAQIFVKKKNYSEAEKFYNIVVNEHGSDILGDNSLFSLAELYEKKLNNKEKAKQLYEQFIENYPGSFFLTEARKRYRLLRGDVLE